MKVLLLSQFFSTTKGGGEYVFKTIAKLLADNNHKVWVITHDIKDEEYYESDNLKIIKVKPTVQYRGSLPPSFSDNIRYAVNAYRKGMDITKGQKIDIIHSNNFAPALAGSFISYFSKVLHITTIHDVFSIYGKDFWKKWSQQSNTSSINARLVPLFEKLMMRLKINCIHTVSQSTKDDIQKIGTNIPIHVIPNCILEEIQVKSKPDKKQFTYLGRLVFYKNIEVILRAIKRVTTEFPDVKIVVAGDGPHKESLQKLTVRLDISGNVTFTGYIPPDKKRKLLAESNALLFPSTIEGFGLVILEAFEQKRPVIVSDILPMSDIVQHTKTGMVLEPYNDERWAEAIVHLIKSPELSDQMGIEANNLLDKKYNQELFYQRITKMYCDVLTDSGQA